VATTILLRHGHSTGNADGILAGWTPGVGLTDRGRGEVAALAAHLTDLPLVRVVSSPIERCVDTARAVVTGREVEVTVDEDLGECRYGTWTGAKLADLTKDPLWRIVQDHPSRARFPDSAEYAGESLADMAHRVVRAIRRHDDEVEAAFGPEAVWVAVTHGDPIKAVVADAMGSHLDHFQRIHTGPASVTVVHYTAQRPLLLMSNATADGLSRLLAPAPPTTPAGDSVVGGDAG
jgi:2,3-bisphosphoglycerate-dependent phosphoglycerate mutase